MSSHARIDELPPGIGIEEMRCLLEQEVCGSGTENTLDLDEDGRPDSQARPPNPRFVANGVALNEAVVPESGFAPALFLALGLLVSLSRFRGTKKA